MEDYKKKYEQARERARDMLSYKEVRREDIEYIFPELKENEDEKIRKWIVRTLKSLNNSSIQIDGAYEMMLPAIAWLEKQNTVKNQWKPTELQLQCLSDAVDAYHEEGFPAPYLTSLLEELKKIYE